jgi:hypothetical protein
MALHSDTDIYKANYDLIFGIVKVVKNMARDFKAIIGGELRDHALMIAILILRANMAEDKMPYLDQIVERKESIDLLTRLSRDLRLISPGQYGEIIELAANVGRQVNGWRKHQQHARQTHGGQGHHDRPLF